MSSVRTVRDLPGLYRVRTAIGIRPCARHVTVRFARHVWNLRSQRGFACVRHALAFEARRGELRVAHYSVQGNHLHLIVETADKRALHYRLFGMEPGESPVEPRRAAQRLLANFLPRAYRRPLSEVVHLETMHGASLAD